MEISDPPDYIRKEFRRSLLEGDQWNLLAANRAYQEFADLRRYALAMEQLVDQAEQADIQALSPEADALDEDDWGEFWAWHYPAHWDQVVRGTFRASTITALISFVETTLSQICRDVRLIIQEDLKPSDLNGSAVGRSKKYLKRFGGFTADQVVWERIGDIVQVRNALVHANGDIDQCRNPRKIREIVSANPGLNESYGAISIDRSYLEHCLGCVENLLSSQLSEMKELCSRRKQFEERKTL